MSLKEIFFKNTSFLFPKYTEATMFLTSLITILILITEPFLQEIVIKFFMADFIFAIVLMFILLGLLLSIYYAFNDKKISRQNKDIMLSFMIVVNVFIGLSASNYLMSSSHGLSVIFPLVNYLNALFLAFAFRYDFINSGSILDIQAKKSEILIGSIVVIAIFLYSRYVLDNYWAMTFSICLVYATNINNFIRKIIIRN
ncbi:hypothetical protein KAT63_01195 [Candidatus Parcubacteria bacterium]|nr:hypothetical protein [Candidatus Parcubacteria bacterium]